MIAQGLALPNPIHGDPYSPHQAGGPSSPDGGHDQRSDIRLIQLGGGAPQRRVRVTLTVTLVSAKAFNQESLTTRKVVSDRPNRDPRLIGHTPVGNPTDSLRRENAASCLEDCVTTVS